ncbi:hypothetical protein QJQ45_025372, partial [Haematococcus lacustris]
MFVSKHKLKLYEYPVALRYEVANNQPVYCTHYVKAHLSIQQFSCFCNLTVMPELVHEYDILLGADWLTVQGALVDYVDKSLTLRTPKGRPVLLPSAINKDPLSRIPVTSATAKTDTDKILVTTRQQKRRLQEGEEAGAGTPLGSGSGGSEQQPAAGSDPDHDADSDDALKPSEPKRLRHLAFAEFAINNSWQESIQSTPFLVNYGQSPITPMLHKLPRPCLSPSAESFAKKWEHEVKHAQECMRVAQDRQERYENKRRRDVTFSVGDSVLLSTKNLRNAPGKARKFLPRQVRFKKRMEYLVKWTGYDDTYNTWEPEANLAGAPQILSSNMTDKEPPGNSNAGSGVTTAPPVTTPLETAFDMMDKLIEAAQANPAMREKFKAVFNTPSGGSMAPEDGPGGGLGDALGEGIEEGEMDVPPGRYTGGDLEYIEELEQRQAQLTAENEAMRQTLSTINTQTAVLKDLAPFKDPTLSQAIDAARQAQRNIVMLATTTPSKGAVSNGQYTATEARRRSGYQNPPNGAKKPGQKSDSKPPSEPEESESEPEQRPPPAQPKGRRSQSARIAHKLKLYEYPVALRYEVANNQPVYCTHYVKAHLSIQQFSCFCNLTVMPELVHEYDILLGADWLTVQGALVDYIDKSLTLRTPKGSPVLLPSAINKDPLSRIPVTSATAKTDTDKILVTTRQQKRRLQEGEEAGAGTPLGSGSGGSEQQPAAGSDSDHDADSDDALKPSEPKRLRHLAFAEFAINNSWQESIQSTPFLVNYGQSPITPMLHKLPRPCLSPSAESFAKKWEHEVKHAQECMRVAQDRQERYENKRRRDVTFSVGDGVLLSTKNLRNAPGKARKFLPRQVRFKKRMEYLVKWTGYDDTYNTWEPEANLAGAPQILSSNMTDKEPPGNSNAGSGVTTAPPVTTPLETAFDMMDKLIEAAQANPAMREKFKAVFNTPSGGSMAPEDGPGGGLGDALGEGIEEGEMDVPPGRYTGGDLEYIEELEQRQAQLTAENEAMRQTLSTINTQ